MSKYFAQQLITAFFSILTMRTRREAETKSNYPGFKTCIFACCLFMLFWPDTQFLAAKPLSQPAISRPSQQAVELAERARREGKLGNDARATHLWNRARRIEPGIPAAPRDWSVERNTQRFIPSLRQRPTTRDELLILISMLPYSRAQKQLRSFLDRFPLDIELRELSLAMAELHNDDRLHRLHDSALSRQSVDNFTWLYGMRLLMLLGYVFLIRLIISFRISNPASAGAAAEASNENAGEQS